MIIDLDYFRNELHIGNLGSEPVRDVLESYVDKYSYDFLKKWLGKDLADNYLDHYEDSQAILDNVIVDRDFKISPIANYVWYYYVKTTYNIHQEIGVVNPNSENSTKINPEIKLIEVWNKMVRTVCDMHKDIYLLKIDNYKYKNDSDICSSCGCYQDIPFKIKNRWGL